MLRLVAKIPPELTSIDQVPLGLETNRSAEQTVPMSVLGRAVLVLIALGATASANGRSPDTSTINFRHGDDSKIAAGMTFGLALSNDAGASWSYVCEVAIGYGGSYDPDYVYGPDGSLFATTFGGLRVSRDGCTFDSTALGSKFISHIAQGPDGRLFATTVALDDAKIYVSADNGMTFPVSAVPPGAVPNDWWQSIEVAPTDADRIYVTGFHFVTNQSKTQLLYRSEDGGQSYVPLATTGMTLAPTSTIEIAQISHVNADIVYAHVIAEDNQYSEGLYRSVDKGQTWTRLFGRSNKLSFLERGNGDLVVATQQVDAASGLGAFVSTDGGTTFTPLSNSPHIGCLVENLAGDVWACTQNFGVTGAPSDGYGIMKTRDLTTWQPVLRFQDIAAPLSCPAGTLQHDTCDVTTWCALCAQLGCDPKRQCGPPSDGLAKPPPGCCSAAAAPTATAYALAIAVGLMLLRPRRRTLAAIRAERRSRPCGS
jgi:hypothetical protein